MYGYSCRIRACVASPGLRSRHLEPGWAGTTGARDVVGALDERRRGLMAISLRSAGPGCPSRRWSDSTSRGWLKPGLFKVRPFRAPPDHPGRLREGASALEAPQSPHDLAATEARAAIAGCAVTADINTVIVGITRRIYYAGEGGPGGEGARGEQDGYGAKNESLHGSLLLWVVHFASGHGLEILSAISVLAELLYLGKVPGTPLSYRAGFAGAPAGTIPRASSTVTT